MFQMILSDSRGQVSDRLIAAELAGSSTVINDDLAGVLMAIVGNVEEPEELRAKRQSLSGQYSKRRIRMDLKILRMFPFPKSLFAISRTGSTNFILKTAFPRKCDGESSKLRCVLPRTGTRRPS